ncbi:TetR/AcrR family transcriptional regulator [Convivina praedatoris]|uniref:HTH tetR-type domain-containing protein n=1 Tax=Convivina praedatoris TaxID=2880963 RepID=A0ABM9D127_9LACO|nr:TetR/AcrR family transcriptional regulator [Convivina sp. LMG 32447]CAH1852157.1 hypothetical protein LMG032447_00508 [Convivina sp. LMG 32447]CAH1852188.1 hypothetical protein R078138_00518 [Convivina sp. LMG 32447]CAH1852758.1 hypothetical protein R077815_00599 [Convivina sp. LMG 32447]
MTNVKDLRYRKNHELIKASFIELLKVKGYAKTTVSQIIATAHINRSTFYVHFLDKEDLMAEIQTELLDDILVSLPALNLDNLMSNQRVEERIGQMSQNVYNNRTMLHLLMSSKGDPTFNQRLIQRAQTELFTSDIVTDIDIPQPYLAASMASLVVNLMLTWVQRDFQESPAEFSEIVKKVGPNFIKSIINRV